MTRYPTRTGRWLAYITESLIRAPRTVLLGGVLAAICSALLTAQRLEFLTERQDLLNPLSPFNQRWLAYDRQFDSRSDVVIVVSGKTRGDVISVIDEIGSELRKYPADYHDVVDRFRCERLLAKGLYYVPLEQLREVHAVVQNAARRKPSVAADDRAAAVSGLADMPAAADWGEQLVSQLRQRFPNYVLGNDGMLGVVTMRLAARGESFVPSAEPIRRLRRRVERVAARYPDIETGLTGAPVLEQAEMQTSQADMQRATLLSMLGVAVLFWAGFGGVRYPAAGLACLVLGVTWTCGYTTLTIGHLNILSVSFGVILIGLGVDFSLHYAARYCDLRKRGAAVSAALVKTAGTTGRTILTGAVTTSVAFLATAWTEFRGVAELGWISAAGVLLCLLATLVMLPCIVQISDAKSDGFVPARMLQLDFLFAPFWRRPWHVIAVTFGLTAYLATGLTQLEFDHDLLKLQSPLLPSVQWERRLMNARDMSTAYAVSLCDAPEQVARRRKQFLSLDRVARVEEICSLVPTAAEPEREALIRSVHRTLLALPQQCPNPEEAHIRQLWNQLNQLRAISSPEPPLASDIPNEIRGRFEGSGGSHLLRVYVRGNAWTTDDLAPFIEQVERVDPMITGEPLQAYYGSQQMKSSYLRAAGLSAMAVLVILCWDLKRPTDVLVAVTPTVMGILQLFGLMGLLAVPLNPANVIILPLIIGIGIDDGVHVIHDFRGRRHGQRGLNSATVAGLVLTSLTSMIGFGSLMTAHHAGLSSLGRVATLGIACCLFCSTILLPCVSGLISPADGVPTDPPN